MERLFVLFGSSLIFAATFLLSGCDKIAGVAADGASHVENVIKPVAKAILGPSEERINAEAICMKEAAARHPGRYVSIYRSNIEGSNKFFIDISSDFTPAEIAAERRRVANGENGQLWARNSIYIECHTDNGLVTRISER